MKKKKDSIQDWVKELADRAEENNRVFLEASFWASWIDFTRERIVWMIGEDFRGE